jgi:predicted ABC-type ATPase
MNNPALTIIAGVNGSRKTTFTLDYFKNSQATFKFGKSTVLQ